VAGKNQDKVTDGVEVGPHEEPQFVEGLIGQEVGLIDDDQGSDARANQLGALDLNPTDHAAPDDGHLETQLVTDMHQQIEGGSRSVLNRKSLIEARLQLGGERAEKGSLATAALADEADETATFDSISQPLDAFLEVLPLEDLIG
jgi:hypothetical protein